MATGPTFSPAEVFPESFGDALEEVVAADRALRAASARKAIAVLKAQREQVHPELFENRMLANRSFRAQIAVLLSITEKAAENLIGYSKVLADAFPRTLAALAEGEFSWQHAVVIVDELGGVHEEHTRGVLEDQALAQAPQVTATRLGRVLSLAREKVNPETIAERHEAAQHLREVSVVDGRDRMSTMFFTHESVMVHAIFSKLTKGAKAIDSPLETRTLGQRRADLFAHFMLAEIDGHPFDVVPDQFDDENFVKWFRGIHAEVVVSVPVLTLLGHSDEPATLDGWVPIDANTARILVGNAKSFTRILTHPETGVVLSVGRKRYKVPKDLRRYLQLRDLTCRFPGCEIAAHRCDIDHTLGWQYGGETNHTNLADLCRGHHTIKGTGLWSVTQAADGSGVMTWKDPTGRSYTTRPHNPLAA